LAFLVKRADPGKAGNGDLLASRWFSAVLAVAIAAAYTRTAIDQHGDSPIDPAAFDFFTVPTLTIRVLYCFFVIDHCRGKMLHFQTTAHPTSEWIVQQLREAFSLPAFTDMSSSITMRSSIRQSASS
jgi:hypothetical protein